MRLDSMRSLSTMAAVVLLPCGCALTNKAEPIPMRYFSPPLHFSPALHPGEATTSAPSEPTVLLRIQRLGVAEHLTENLAYRQSPTEVAYYETLRWTETPDVYLGRALDEVLFANSNIQRAVVQGELALDVQLAAFEELKYGAPRVRVVLYVAIADDALVLKERWVEVEKQIPAGADPDEHPRNVAQALDDALTAAAQSVKQEILRLAERSPATTPDAARGELDPATERVNPPQ